MNKIKLLEYTRKKRKELKEKTDKPQGIEIGLIGGLYDFVKNNKINFIVETGVCYGFSSLAFLAALPEDGFLISFEYDLKSRNKLIVPLKYWKKWIPIQNDSIAGIKLLYNAIKTNTEEKNSLFWHDSLHTEYHQTKEYELARELGFNYLGSHDINRDHYAWRKFRQAAHYEKIYQTKKSAIIKL